MLRWLKDLLPRPLTRRPHTIRHPAAPRKYLWGPERLEDRTTPSGTPAYAVGAAPGGEPTVSVYDGDGNLVTSFLAYEETFTGGVRTAMADLNGDGTPDIVTAPGPGGGPRVRAFDGNTGDVLADFYAYDQSFLGGVWVAAGPVGSGQVGIATGADAGGGPQVEVFGGDGTLLQSFFAFDETFTGGVRVALGQTEDGADVYAANGPGMAPTVRGFDVATATQAFEQAAGDESETGGVYVGTGDLLGDGRDDVVTAAPSGSDTELRVFDGANGTWANQATATGAAYGVGILSWGGQRAVAVLGTTALTMYALGNFGDPPTALGSVAAAGSAGGVGAVDPGVATDAIPAGTIVYTGSSADYHGAHVDLTVRVLADGNYRWEYTVTNDSFWGGTVISYFSVGFPGSDPVDVSAGANDLDWYNPEDGDAAGAEWSQIPGESDDVYIGPGGGTGTFSFTTTPRPVVTGQAALDDSGGFDCAVPGDKPQIQITDGAANVAPTLKVAKWQDAFEMDGTDAVKIKAPNQPDPPDATTNLDFIDRDPDRFNVWVYDRAAWDAQTPHIQAKISTKNVVGFTEYDDPATAVDLVRYTGPARGPGWFWSDSQMLVSNEVDDTKPTVAYLGADESAPGAAGLDKNGYTGANTWKVSDRTHRVALRGTVTAEYTTGGDTVKAQARVPATKNVKVHTTILRDKAKADGGKPVIGDEKTAEGEANKAIHNANEQYAQVGILLIPFHFQVIDPPITLSDGLDASTADPDTTETEPTTEEAALLDPKFRTMAEDDVELYFVNYFTDKPNRKGEAFSAANVSASRYMDSVVISADKRTPFTIAHEIGHVLTNAGHYEDPPAYANLMRAGGTSTADSETASKRLTPDQQTAILTKRPNLLTGP